MTEKISLKDGNVKKGILLKYGKPQLLLKYTEIGKDV